MSTLLRLIGRSLRRWPSVDLVPFFFACRRGVPALARAPGAGEGRGGVVTPLALAHKVNKMSRLDVGHVLAVKVPLRLLRLIRRYRLGCVFRDAGVAAVVAVLRENGVDFGSGVAVARQSVLQDGPRHQGGRQHV